MNTFLLEKMNNKCYVRKQTRPCWLVGVVVCPCMSCWNMEPIQNLFTQSKDHSKKPGDSIVDFVFTEQTRTQSSSVDDELYPDE